MSGWCVSKKDNVKTKKIKSPPNFIETMSSEQQFITSCALGEEFKVEDLLKAGSVDPNCKDAKVNWS